MKNSYLSILACTAVAITSTQAASYITTGQTVTGTTVAGNFSGATAGGNVKSSSFTPTTGSITIGDGTSPPNDFFITLVNQNINTNLYSYMQIDFAGFSSLNGNGGTQLFLSQDNSISGPELVPGLAPVTPSTSPFSLVIDLSSEALWTGTDLDGVRIDPFNGPNYNDEDRVITITGITFGSDLTPVPEPSSTALLGLAGLALILRRRTS